MSLVDPAAEREYLAVRLNTPDADVRVAPTDFGVGEHEAVARAIDALDRRGEPADPYEVITELERSGMPAATADRIVRELAADTAALVAAPAARRVRDVARRRRLAEALKRAAAGVESGDPVEARREALSALEAETGEAPYRVRTMREVAQSVWEHAQSQGRRPTVRLGLPGLDRAVGGLLAGSMTIVGGVTGAGKSGLMLACARAMAREGRRPGVLSLEDPAEVWGARAIGAEARMDSRGLLTGEITRDAGPALTAATERLASMDMLLAFAVGAESDAVCEATQDLINRGCGAVFVDYVQAVRVDLKVSRYDKAVGDVAKRLKGICHRAGVPLILGSQVRRPTGDPFAEPHLTALKETGDLENEAECVLLLWKDSDDVDHRVFGKVAKLKTGPAGQRFELVREGGIVRDVELRSRDETKASHGGKAWA